MKKIFILISLFFLIACNDNKYEFDLEGKDKNYKLSDFKGENVLVYFGYTFCADVCPTSLAIAAEALKSTNHEDVKIIFITLDPKRDDAANVDEFVKYFYPNSIGLRPSEEELKRITKNYGAKYQYLYQDSAATYTVAHSSSFYIFDKFSNYKGEISNLAMNNVKKKINEFLSKD